MAPEAIELSVRGDSGTGSYRFICPACLTLVEKRADRKIVDLLSSVGVSVSGGTAVSGAGAGDDGQSALELFGAGVPAGEPGRSPLTYDDLISFHFLLEDDEWLAEVIQEPGKVRPRPRRRSPPT